MTSAWLAKGVVLFYARKRTLAKNFLFSPKQLGSSRSSCRVQASAEVPCIHPATCPAHLLVPIQTESMTSHVETCPPSPPPFSAQILSWVGSSLRTKTEILHMVLTAPCVLATFTFPPGQPGPPPGPHARPWAALSPLCPLASILVRALGKALPARLPSSDPSGGCRLRPLLLP